MRTKIIVPATLAALLTFGAAACDDGAESVEVEQQESEDMTEEEMSDDMTEEEMSDDMSDDEMSDDMTEDNG